LPLGGAVNDINPLTKYQSYYHSTSSNFALHVSKVELCSISPQSHIGCDTLDLLSVICRRCLLYVLYQRCIMCKRFPRCVALLSLSIFSISLDPSYEAQWSYRVKRLTVSSRYIYRRLCRTVPQCTTPSKSLVTPFFSDLICAVIMCADRTKQPILKQSRVMVQKFYIELFS
jgi:hypothetical protein